MAVYKKKLFQKLAHLHNPVEEGMDFRQTAAPGYALEGSPGHYFAEHGARGAEIGIWRTQIIKKRHQNPLQGGCPCGSLAKEQELL